jgi:O-methyltransferase
MSIRNCVVRMGVGPFRKPAELLADYAKFGDWIKAHPCDHAFKNRYLLYEYINGSVLNQEPMDYLEFGVYQGESIRHWSRLNAAKASRFFGFDSFEGLPERWQGSVFGFNAMEKNAFDVGGSIPVIEDPRVEFVKGYFQDSLPGFLERFRPSNRLVIHMDADLYTSTLYVLCMLDRFIKKDTLIMFDEFASIAHEFRALKDYVTSFRRKYKLMACTKPGFHQVAIQIDD